MSHAEQQNDELFPSRYVLVNGPVIIGAGPAGLAVAAGLKQQGVPFVILERSNCIASLWQNKTYDRLKLHLPRKFCQLPYFPFPGNFPEYPTKCQFIEYLESYAKEFEINPMFNESVRFAKFDVKCGFWRVRSVRSSDGLIVEYISRWIVVATGENSEKVVPEFEGIHEFEGGVVHACDYKSGVVYQGKKVLVVGCGNSGMEISLDLCHHNAYPSMVVRNAVHVLPREILGKSTFHLGVSMMKWMPQRVVDKLLLIASRVMLGNLEKHGIKRPSMGPLKLKDIEGKTPVLDIGTLQKIKSGDIKVVPGVVKFLPGGVELADGQVLEVDSVVFATGYRSNVPLWLHGNELFSRKGHPRTPFPNGWKGKDGLYAVGFTRRGLSGASLDAIRVAQDVATIWKQETQQINQLLSFTCHRRGKSPFYERIKGTKMLFSRRN